MGLSTENLPMQRHGPSLEFFPERSPSEQMDPSCPGEPEGEVSECHKEGVGSPEPTWGR
jgi:hypothetical protein